MPNQSYLLRFTLAVCVLAAPLPAFSIAIEEIKGASAEARKAAAATGQPSTTRLEAALKRGDEIISKLQSEVETLKAERTQLVQVQTTLASGLIGALVTAIVAIGGAILNSRSSKPDRNLKRLAVMEKAHELTGKGMQVPEDITHAYELARDPR